MSKQNYKLISKKIVVDNKWTTIVEESFKTEVGLAGNYLIVERQPALMIIPIVKIQDSFYTYLVKQYRYPIAKEVWQFPMGMLELNTDPMEHAKKELKEETGLESGSITFAGSYYIDPGLSRQQCYVYIAKDIVEGGEQNLEESERGMIAKRFSIEELERLVDENKIIDGWIFQGLFFLKHFLLK